MTQYHFWATAAISIALSVAQVQAAPRNGQATAQELAMATLNDIQASAVQLHTDATQLTHVMNDPWLERDSHIDALMSIKSDVNHMASEIRHLQAEMAALPSWEQAAISEVAPLIGQSAANAESAIKYFNENRPRPWPSPEYRSYADTIARDSARIATCLRDYVQLAKLHRDERRIDESLTRAGGQ